MAKSKEWKDLGVSNGNSLDVGQPEGSPATSLRDSVSTEQVVVLTEPHCVFKNGKKRTLFHSHWCLGTPLLRKVGRLRGSHMQKVVS